MEAYRIQLNQLIAEKKNEDSDISAYADLISETEAIRGECLRIHRMDFLEAPLGYPLSGAAPWADVVTDLEDLPWPSQQHAAEEPAEVKALPSSGPPLPTALPARFPLPLPSSLEEAAVPSANCCAFLRKRIEGDHHESCTGIVPTGNGMFSKK